MLSVQLAVSLLSFVGSLMIISQVSRSKINRSTPQQRLILLISVCDIVLGICWIFNPLLMYNSGVPYWARGNQVTCSVQGFMIQLSILTGALYQASLQLQYLLGIKYGWTQRQLKWGFSVTCHEYSLQTHNSRILCLKQTKEHRKVSTLRSIGFRTGDCNFKLGSKELQSRWLGLLDCTVSIKLHF